MRIALARFFCKAEAVLVVQPTLSSGEPGDGTHVWGSQHGKGIAVKASTSYFIKEKKSCKCLCL